MTEMRRKDRAKSREFSLELIDRCTHGVMALTTGEDTPYCLPLTFARVENSLYFHCAHTGRKIDLLRACPNVCITFVGQDRPTHEVEINNFTTKFASAIVTGTAREVTDEAEKIAALSALCQKTLPHAMADDSFQRAVASSLHRTAIWRIDMEEISGKSNA